MSLTSSFPFAQALLSWYEANARTLPWRMPPQSAEKPEAYHVWLSETMLQQTTVATVIPYFQKFLDQWPTLHHLSTAPLDDIMAAWAGLGYYARARNLHKCAQQVVETHGGNFPAEENALRQLAGIGPYTAAAISSIAFHQRAVVVDGNIERVISRFFAIETPLPLSKPLIYQYTDSVTPTKQAGDFAQGMMDIGATICTPRRPQCPSCPLQGGCQAFLSGQSPERFPLKAPKKQRPKKYGWAFVVEWNTHLWIRKRPPKGLLGGLWEFPTTLWEEIRPLPTPPALSKAGYAQFQGCLRDLGNAPTEVKHTFTHFDLFLTPVHLTLSRPEDLEETDGIWCPQEELSRYGLPTLMKKVLALPKKTAPRQPSLF